MLNPQLSDGTPNDQDTLCTHELKSVLQHQEDIFKKIRAFVENDALQGDLYCAEKRIFELVLNLGRTYLGEVIARMGSGNGAEVKDAHGQRLPLHDEKKDTTYLSIFGHINIRRAYFWKEGHEGICPLDNRLNLPQRRYSHLLCDWTQASITENPFDIAVERSSKLLGIPVSKRGQETVAREAGKKFDDYYEQKPPFDPATEGSHIGIETDCKGVRMVTAEKPEQASVTPENPARRGKGEKSGGLRKMAVATADFSFNPRIRTPEEMVAILMREAPKPNHNMGVDEEVKKQKIAMNSTIAASMGGKRVAMSSLLNRVRKRDPTGEKKMILLMDGEPSLEERMMELLKEYGMYERVDAVILDIMHAMGYLWSVGTALYGEKGRARIPWVREKALEILRGHVGYVIGGLRIILKKGTLKPSRRDALTKAITYFDNHKHMMAYDRYVAAGYPIATGLIEGVCGSLIKDRADRSGSRWSSVGVQAVLNERAIMKNGDWDNFWQYHMKTEHQRLYGRFTIKWR